MTSRDFSRLPHLGRLRDIEQALSSIEGWTWGPWLRFSAHGYTDQLHIDLGSWTKIEHFDRLPGLRELAEDLNVAMKPVLDAYAAFLREEMVRELAKVSARALDVTAVQDGDPQPSPTEGEKT